MFYKSMMRTTATLLCLGFAASALAQGNPPQAAVQTSAQMVNRTVPAIAYGERRGSTTITLGGTSLMPNSLGEAKVERRQGVTRVETRFVALPPPTTFGNEYLTYLLWAVSPEGRTFNLGELVLNRERSSLNVTTPLQTFALVVTAEPYYAVRVPSDVIVLENILPPNAPLVTQPVKFELIGRGGYVPTGYRFDPVLLTTNLPQEFFQARNAMRIAESVGAATHAANVYETAVRQMQRVDELASQRRPDRRAIQSAAREAVQTAEDAREMSVRRAEEERVQAERAEAAREAARRDEENRLAQEARLKAEADRLAAERERLEAVTAAQEAIRGQAEAERLRLEEQRRQEAARADAERSRAAALALDQQVQQLLQEREGLRAQLHAQLNAILDTQDTARGLVVNLSDVTFATGQATLQPQAREKLAQISGILLAHPTLRLEIEGHTDSVGSDEMNQGLSERRAESVRSYLEQLRVTSDRMSAVGFGKTRPVATNDTAAGRQLNRRVELVVSGDAIGS